MLNPQITFEARDEYNRKPIAEKIKKLIESGIIFSPMVIDGKWGQGKTEFCYKLKNYLDEGGIKCVYIDAYKNDYFDDPLLTIFSSIASVIDNQTTKTALIKKAIPVFSFGIKVLGKAGVKWLLKQDVDTLGEDFESAVSQSTDAIFDLTAKRLIEEYQEQEKNLETLKTALETSTEREPLIIFIDELDRCRPSYAVAMIEKIKHVFNIPSISFILVCNSEQLVAAVKHIYGHIDAEDYLNKFVLTNIKLNQYIGDDFHRKHNSEKHFQILISTSEDLDSFKNPSANANRFISNLIRENNVSLRQVEKIITRLKILILFSKVPFTEADILYQIISTSIMFLECLNSKAVDDIDRGLTKGDNITSALFGTETVEKLWINYDEIDHWTRVLLVANHRWSLGTEYTPGTNVKLDRIIESINSSHAYFFASSFEQLLESIYKDAIRTVRLSSI